MHQKRTNTSYSQLKAIYSNRRTSMPDQLSEPHYLQKTQANGFRSNTSMMLIDQNDQQHSHRQPPTIQLGSTIFQVKPADGYSSNKEQYSDHILAHSEVLRKNGFKPQKEVPQDDIRIKTFTVFNFGIKQDASEQNQKIIKENSRKSLEQSKSPKSNKISKSPQAIPESPEMRPSYINSPPSENYQAKDIFKLMEHNNVLAQRMKDLQQIIADQKKNIDQLPSIHNKNCHHNHSNHEHSGSQTRIKQTIKPQIKQHLKNQGFHKKSRSKMEDIKKSNFLTSRNNFAKQRNEQLMSDYSEQNNDIMQEGKLRELIKIKKKKVHRLASTKRSESVEPTISIKIDQTQRTLKQLKHPVKNRFFESKLLTINDDKLHSIYQPRNSQMKKCHFNSTSIHHDQELTWQEKTYHNLQKLHIAPLQLQKPDLVNSFNFKYSDLQLVQLK